MSDTKTLTIEQANELVGDDISYWLNNPFMTPDMLARKVCFWLDAVRRKAGDDRAQQAWDEGLAASYVYPEPENPYRAERIIGGES